MPENTACMNGEVIGNIERFEYDGNKMLETNGGKFIVYGYDSSAITGCLKVFGGDLRLASVVYAGPNAEELT